MNAVISGRAGLALVIEGESLMSLDVDDLDTLVPRDPSDLRFLLADAADLVTLENTDRHEIAQRLDLEHDIACALDMTLIALDPGGSMELRTEAIAALDELLADLRVVGRLESTLYAKPLPGAADLAGAQLSAGANKTARSLFERLGLHQSAISAVREAWDAIPDIVFGEGENARAEFHDAAHREGMFRTLGLSYGDSAKVSSFLLDVINHESIRTLHNHYEVLGRWCAPIQQASSALGDTRAANHDASNEGVGQAFGVTGARGPRTEDSTRPANSAPTGGATMSPSLSVLRFPRVSADLTFEKWSPRGGRIIALNLSVGVTLAIGSSIYAALQGAFGAPDKLRWFLALLSAIQFLVVSAALAYRPQGPKGFLNTDPLRMYDGSMTAAESAIMKNAGYDNPDEWREAKHFAETALRQYTGCWMGLLLSWLVLYAVLTLKYLVEAKTGIEWPSLKIGATFLNNSNSLAIFFCYVVLARVTVIRKQERLAEEIPFARGAAALLFFTLAEILLLVVLSGVGSDSKPLLKWADTISGIVGAITMILFVGRLGSKFLGSRTWLVVFLYAYTAIQPLYESLGASHPASVFILDAALFLKCLLYLYMTWLFQSGRLLFYFTRIRQLDERVDIHWSDFRSILGKAA